MNSITYAGFWRRLAALFIDSSLLGTLFLILNYGLGYFSIEKIEQSPWQLFLVNDLLAALIIILYWIRCAATPGKLLFNCEIVQVTTYTAITPLQALLRYLGYFISAIPLGLGFLWILRDTRKQGWHDKMARTVVILRDESQIPLSQLMKEAQ